MAKKRVHEIAKERGITSKEALQVLQEAGLKVTAPASSVEESDAARAFENGAAPASADQGSSAACRGGRDGSRPEEAVSSRSGRRRPLPHPGRRRAAGRPAERR